MIKTLALAMTLLIGGIAFGQEPATKKGPTPEDRAARLTEQMKKELILTADQEVTVAEINLGIAKKNEGIRNNTSFTPEKKREIYDSNEAARKAMLKGVLTPEQFQRYEEKEAKRQIKKEERQEGMKAEPAKKIEPKTEE